MNNTKNVKGNRMMLSVTYINTCVDYYKIPVDLDILDETVVEEYWVKWRTLYIKYVGKDKVEEYAATYEDTETDFKRPSEVEVTEADDIYICYDEDEEEEKKESDNPRVEIAEEKNEDKMN